MILFEMRECVPHGIEICPQQYLLFHVNLNSTTCGGIYRVTPVLHLQASHPTLETTEPRVQNMSTACSKDATIIMKLLVGYIALAVQQQVV